jgi:hypothetical protein
VPFCPLDFVQIPDGLNAAKLESTFGITPGARCLVILPLKLFPVSRVIREFVYCTRYVAPSPGVQ